jgi:probable phosphoglycerate mutase
MTELILIRHGVTAWNRERRFQGQIDIPLDDEGHWQAGRLAAALASEPLSAVYASDLSRAWHTARPLAETLGLAPTAEPRLRERFYGAFEGRTFDELQRDAAEDFARWRARDPDFALPGGGETLRVLYARVEALLLALARRHPGERIAAVTHGGVLDCAYRVATGLGLSEPRHHELLNASVNRIAFDGERFSLVSWGEVEHLRRADDAIEGD